MSTANATLMDHEHGAVNNRCSHLDCQAAFARWSKRYKLDLHQGIPRTRDGQLARDHLAKLEGAGWTLRGIASQAGVSAAALSRINLGQKTVRVGILDKILAVDPATLPHKPHRQSAYVFVPRVGTVRRIQAMLALGWTHAHIMAASGVSTRILLSQQGRWVARPTHDAVATAYRELSGRAGPSKLTRRRAELLGYLSPAAWDDIDIDAEPDDSVDLDPDEGVDEVLISRILTSTAADVATLSATLTLAEKHVVTDAWLDTGRAWNELERLTGWKHGRYGRTRAGEAA